MKVYESKNIRNVGLIGHSRSGKTSLGEALLFETHAIERLGKVDEGTSTLDFEPEEIKRKISISSSLHHLEWQKNKINIVDTPGDSNFLSDTKASLMAMDGAIVLLDCTQGVEIQTEKVWSYTEELSLPRAIFINKMDKERADFIPVIKDIEESFHIKPLILQLPLGVEENFKGIIDLVRMKALTYQDQGKGQYEVGDIPPEFLKEAEGYRLRLIEDIAEIDDSLLEKYLAEETLTDQELYGALKKGLIETKVAPILLGSATRNIGIDPLLDLIAGIFPSPLDRGRIKGVNPKTNKEEERIASPDAPFSALVFKTLADPYTGKLTILRIYSGLLNSDTLVYNATKDIKERIGQLMVVEGKVQKAVNPAPPGDIVAVAKLKETTTGDTFCDDKSPIIYKFPVSPSFIISFAIEPKAKGDEEKIINSLNRLMEEDPTLRVERHPQTKEIILQGMGQTHLEVTTEKLKRKFGVEVEMKSPKIPYKETISATARVQGKYKKQSGGRGQYGDCWLELEPLPRAKGFEFVDKIVGGVIPKQYIPSIEKGIIDAMHEGVLAGCPVVDLKVSVVDGTYHVVDSSDIAFKIAGSMGFKKGVMEAKPILLEPIMSFEVTVPEEYLGDVIGDMNSRRGKVLGMEPKGKNQVIKATVPMAEVLRYASDLISITSGRGGFTMEFAYYEEVPHPIAEKIIAEANKEKEKEKEK